MLKKLKDLTQKNSVESCTKKKRVSKVLERPVLLHFGEVFERLYSMFPDQSFSSYVYENILSNLFPQKSKGLVRNANSKSSLLETSWV